MNEDLPEHETELLEAANRVAESLKTYEQRTVEVIGRAAWADPATLNPSTTTDPFRVLYQVRLIRDEAISAAEPIRDKSKWWSERLGLRLLRKPDSWQNLHKFGVCRLI